MSGIDITGELVPKGAGGYALLSELNLRGGYRAVSNKVALLAIPSGVRKSSMVAFVESYRRHFRWVPDGAVTPNPGEVINDTGGQWHAVLPFSDIAWRDQPEFNISASTGNDEATGLIGAPLKSIEEVRRRINGLHFSQSVAVTVLDGDIGDLIFDPTFESQPDPDAEPYRLTIQSTPSSWTQLASGTLAAGTLPLVRGSQVNTLVCSDPGFDWSPMLNARVRIVAGPHDGCCAWIDKIISPTTCTTKYFQRDDLVFVSPALTRQSPAAGDAFVVEALPGCGNVNTRHSRFGRKADLRGYYGTLVVGFDIGKNVADSHSIGVAMESNSNDVSPALIGCRVRCASIVGSGLSFLRLVNTLLTPSDDGIPVVFNAIMFGGGQTGNNNSSGGAGLFFAAGPRGAWTIFDAVFRGMGGAVNLIGRGNIDAAVFDSAGDGVLFLQVNNGGEALITGGGRLWGNNNSGYGIRMEPPSTIYLAATANKPTLTGALGDTIVSGIDVPYSVHPAYAADKLCGMVLQ